MLEPSWRDDIAVVVSPLLGAVATLDKELARPVAVDVGSEGDTAWSTWCSVWHTQGVCPLDARASE